MIETARHGPDQSYTAAEQANSTSLQKMAARIYTMALSMPIPESVGPFTSNVPS